VLDQAENQLLAAGHVGARGAERIVLRLQIVIPSFPGWAVH
jgi:hypothetical protein